MHDFPPELWSQIGAYLPDDALQRMLDVNRTLYQLSMDVRYREVGVYKWNKKTERLLSRVQDPMVGKHVRRFRLVLLNETMPSTLSHPFRQVHAPKASAVRSAKQAFHALIEALSASFLSMPKVEELFLRLGEVVPEYEDALRVFFEHMWIRVGTKLKTLKFFATLGSFPLCIPPSSVSFPALRGLDMDFWDERFFLPNDVSDEAVLSDTIPPFLNSLAPQLQSLSISTYVFSRDHHDITTLFQYLDHFPLLSSLGIQLISHRAERSDDIRGFIEKHVSQLSTLRLHTRCWQDDTLLSTLLSGCLPAPPSSVPSASSSRIQLPVSPPLQLHLKTLDLYSYSFALCLDPLISIINSTEDTLETLSLESALTKEDVHYTVKTLSACPNLSNLTFHLPGIDIALFDLLYAKLPSLRKLTLRYNEIGMEVHPISKQVITLQRALRKRKYQHWALEDLSIFYDWKALNIGTMRSFAKSIPSLRSFWGKGDMRSVPAGERWRDGWIWVLAGPWVLKRGIVSGMKRLFMEVVRGG